MRALTTKSFGKGALILVSTNLIAKVLGALYRIPLTNLLGIQGIGLYQMIIPTLLLALALTSNYIPIVMSKTIAYLSEGEENKETIKIFKSALLLVVFITTIFSFILLALSKNLALIQKEPNLIYCYLLLIPTIIFSGIKNVFRGWFYGFKDMLFPSISQLVEQIVKIGTSLLFAWFFIKKGIIFSVMGAIAGLVVGEIIGLLFLAIVRSIKKIPIKIDAIDYKVYYRLLINESTPIMLANIVFPIISFIDSFLIVNLLTYSGTSSPQAISEYGLLQGPVYSLINLPIMISISLSLAIIPLVSSLYSNGEVSEIKTKSNMSIKLCFSLVMPACVGLCLIAKPLFTILYPALTIIEINYCVQLLVYSSINIISLSLLEIINSILQGLSQAKYAARSMVIGSISKIIVECISIYYLGIYGAIVSNIVFYLIALTLNSIRYRKLIGDDFSLLQNIGKILVSSVIMALVIYFSTIKVNNDIIKIVISLAVGVVSYFVLIFGIKAFNFKELSTIPGGKKVIKLFRYKEECND